MMESRSAHHTVRGRRPRNEDAVVDLLLPDGRHLMAVADGMGGNRAGDVASATAAEALTRAVGSGLDLADAMSAANRAVLDAARRDPAYHGMGTTLVALLRSGSTYRIANVGDSRAYRIDRSGGLRQITTDHSFAAEALRAGAMTPAEVARSPWRNALTRSLGLDDDLEVDVFGPFEIDGPPHAVLLCTDGLYKAVPDPVMGDTIRSAGGVGEAVELLAALALDHQSDDNVSAGIMEFGPLLRRPTLWPAHGHPTEIASIRPSVAPPRAEAGFRMRPGGARLAVPPAPEPARIQPQTESLLQRRKEPLLSDGRLFVLCVVAFLAWLVLYLWKA